MKRVWVQTEGGHLCHSVQAWGGGGGAHGNGHTKRVCGGEYMKRVWAQAWEGARGGEYMRRVWAQAW